MEDLLAIVVYTDDARLIDGVLAQLNCLPSVPVNMTSSVPVYALSQQINVMQLMLDTLDVVMQLAQLTAAHTHAGTGPPTNAAAIAQTGSQADTLKKKYKPVIG